MGGRCIERAANGDQRSGSRTFQRDGSLLAESEHAKLAVTVKTESIQPIKALSGSIELPGDKSISHRYAMLAALANGTSELRNFAAARDCHSTLGCMKSLGAGVKVDGTTVQVTGHGLRGLKSSWRALDAENSGNDDTATFGDFEWAIVHDEDYRRCFFAETADEAGDDAAARNGRGHSRARRKFSATGDSWREVACDPLPDADGQCASEVRGAAGWTVRRGRNNGNGTGGDARSYGTGAAGV